MTAASGSQPYCTVDQFFAFRDERSVRQLLSDTGAAVTGELSDNAQLATLLSAASGKVESAACLGQRYVIDSETNDLASLTGNSAAFLAKLVADLAFFDLWKRRPNPTAQQRMPPECEEAEKFLERLRLGERVFGVLESHEAAHVQANVETAARVVERNGVTVIADRFFGTRRNRLMP